MTTYVKRQIDISVAEKQNMSDLIFSRGGTQVKFDADATLDEAEMLKYALSIPTTDRDLMDGSSISAARILILETDTELTVKLNAIGDTGITVKPINSSTRAILYLEGDFSHVYVTIAGASGTSNVVMGVVGV